MPAPTNPGPASTRTAVTVLLTNDQTAFMDEIAAAIRRNTGESISRSAMVRAIVSAVDPYFREWLKCRSEAELKEVITQRLQVGGHPPQQQPKVAQTQTR